jgi:hypothetical protein
MWLFSLAAAPGQTNATRTILTDTNRFPIGVWVQDPANAARYAAAGINLYVGLWEGPTQEQFAALRNTGIAVICHQTEFALRHPDNTNIVAWMHDDEPDNSRTRGARFGFGSPVTPEKVVEHYRLWKSNDVTRPVFLNLGQGAAWDGWYGRGRRNNHPEDYPRYLEGCDIASFDIYPVNHPSREVAGNLWFVARGVERLIRWTDGRKPVWNVIQCTRIDNPDRKPRPHEVRATVWMSLIHGSRGLVYFVHQFKPEFREAALLDDSEMLAAVTGINSQIARLAPVLHSPSLTNAVKVETSNPAVPVATMVKRVDGETWLFAVAMRDGVTRATFSLNGIEPEQTAEVLDESRSVDVVNGRFSDTFRSWAVHSYRLRNKRAQQTEPAR